MEKKLRSLMYIGSVDDQNLAFEIPIPNTFTVLVDDLISGIYHLMEEAIKNLPEDKQEAGRSEIHAHVVQAFSLVVDKFHTTITPTVEEELRDLIDATDKSK